MPSAPPSRGGFTYQPVRFSKQSRYSSTGQDLSISQNDERMAAALHGKKRDGGGKGAIANIRRPPLEDAPSQPSHQSAIPSPNDVQKFKFTLSRRSNENPRQPQHREGRGSAGIKRVAIAAQNQPLAKRQRSDATKLKDEAYIRSTMNLPTPQDYPDLPKDVFKAPRKPIAVVAHGNHLAECRSEFVTLSRDAYQCTAYYNSTIHNEAAIGEGRTQASRSVL